MFMKKLSQLLILGLLFVVSNLYAATNPVSITDSPGLSKVTVKGNTYVITYKLTNNLPFPIPDLTVAPSTTNGSFTLSSTDCAALAAGASCEWNGSFTPSQAGTTQTTVTLNYLNGSPVPYSQQSTTQSPILMALTIADDLSTTNAIALSAVYTSSDAVTWTKHVIDSTATNHYASIATDKKGTWLVASSTELGIIIYKSTDNGVTWAKQSPTLTPRGNLPTITYSNNQWVLTSSFALRSQQPQQSTSPTMPPLIYTSQDGTTWQQASIPATNDDIDLLSTHFANNVWVSVGLNRSQDNGDNILYTSTDNALNWAPITLPTTTDNPNLRSVAFGDGVWITTGDNSRNADNTVSLYKSTDATASSWTNISSTLPGKINDGRQIAYADGEWVLTGVTVEDRAPVLFHSENNGQNWTPVPAVQLEDVSYMNKISHTFNGWFIATSQTNSNAGLLKSDDGITWSVIDLPNSAGFFTMQIIDN